MHWSYQIHSESMHSMKSFNIRFVLILLMNNVMDVFVIARTPSLLIGICLILQAVGKENCTLAISGLSSDANTYPDDPPHTH